MKQRHESGLKSHKTNISLDHKHQIYVSDTETTFSKFAQLSMTHSCCIG